MASQSAPFLTVSKHGVWYYQRWMPLHFRKFGTILSPVVRFSLRPRDKRCAVRISRLLRVKLDQLALQYFDCPESFGKGMELLYQSARAKHRYSNWDDYEEIF